MSNNQFGFRKNLSTIDALTKVKHFIEKETSQGNTVIAISLDIKNAFNSIPWSRIRKALFRKKCPRYLRRMIHSYLSSRKIEYVDIKRKLQSVIVNAGVLQGSVTGPLLWNIAYDTVLHVDKDPGCDLICYVDDTMIIVSGESYDEAQTKACILTDSLQNQRLKTKSYDRKNRSYSL